MSRKALFTAMAAEAPGLKAELTKVAVAADLTVLLAQSGMSRAELAKRLGWSRARVTQVLSGEGNLTLETVHAVAEALGSAFDLVFRKPFEKRASQPWERGMSLSLNTSGEVLQSSLKSPPMAERSIPSLRLVRAKAGATPPLLMKQHLQAADLPMEWACAA